MACRELQQHRQMLRPDQCIEGEPLVDERTKRGRERGLQHPARVRDVLDHGAHADELVIFGQRREHVGCVGLLEIDPADDARDEVVRAREFQYEAGFGHRWGSLYDDRFLYRAVREMRQQVFRLEIAIQRDEIWREPTVVASAQTPEMLMTIEHADEFAMRAAHDGTGALGSRSSALRSASHNSLGMG